MSELLSREFTDLSVRADMTGRTITGIVVPFERAAMVSDGGPRYEEMFRKGAFTKTIAERGSRVKLLTHHDARSLPLGRATLLREDTAGLYGEFAVSRTVAGDEALELVRDGALDAFSVGFAPMHHVREGRTTVRTEVALREASLVNFPAYPDALVGSVRADDLSDDDLRAIAARLAQFQPGTPGEPPSEGTPPGAAHTDEEPPSALRADLTPAQRLAIVRAALRTRGLAS